MEVLLSVARRIEERLKVMEDEEDGRRLKMNVAMKKPPLLNDKAVSVWEAFMLRFRPQRATFGAFAVILVQNFDFVVAGFRVWSWQLGFSVLDVACSFELCSFCAVALMFMQAWSFRRWRAAFGCDAFGA
ncbi:uncharacterized protein LOC127105760 isoform X2 [Lathyrus oleraceus]|uniref:uncharacterized protein LOC127105760 isoform X2 n=1 Tax=Pisum sativum TaxID=3888 RepID=UPI0021D14A1B|nr:uncharacterized protein LOC127105760 isoform X2 [Pisum sativum]